MSRDYDHRLDIDGTVLLEHQERTREPDLLSVNIIGAIERAFMDFPFRIEGFNLEHYELSHLYIGDLDPATPVKARYGDGALVRWYPAGGKVRMELSFDEAVLDEGDLVWTREDGFLGGGEA